jgi:hypothetical protein
VESIAIISLCLLQVRAAVEALRNVRGLPWQTVKESHPRAGDLDCLDWLQDMFGFQVWLLLGFCGVVVGSEDSLFY